MTQWERIKKELEKPQREAVRIINEMEWVLHRGQGDELHLFPEKEQLKMGENVGDNERHGQGGKMSGTDDFSMLYQISRLLRPPK
ncbi:hypothetical protein LUU34_00612800 [Aix galericulata]|nr:hypothetical protein LUU34_00612800 [Aix galericulata]